MSEIGSANGLRPQSDAGRLLMKLTALILLVSVAGLATGAKNSLYYPQDTSVHYLSIGSKAKVAASPAQIDRSPLRLIAKLVPPRPAIRVAFEKKTEAPPIQRLCVTVALQHRSPPSVL
ncbi:MAG: hypothetical protein WCC76_18720 [Candidatus Acidiferrales bacterium]